MRLQIQHIHWIHQPVSVFFCVALSQNDKQIRWTFSHQLLPKSFHKQHKMKISVCVVFCSITTYTDKLIWNSERKQKKLWRKFKFKKLAFQFHFVGIPRYVIFFAPQFEKKKHQLFVSFKNGPCHQTNYNICNQNILTSRHHIFSRHVNLRRNFKRLSNTFDTILCCDRDLLLLSTWSVFHFKY